MASLADSLSEFTLQVVLATFSQTQEREFDQSVRKEFYENYWKTSKEYLANPEEDKDYGLLYCMEIPKIISYITL